MNNTKRSDTKMLARIKILKVHMTPQKGISAVTIVSFHWFHLNSNTLKIVRCIFGILKIVNTLHCQQLYVLSWLWSDILLVQGPSTLHVLIQSSKKDYTLFIKHCFNTVYILGNQTWLSHDIGCTVQWAQDNIKHGSNASLVYIWGGRMLFLIYWKYPFQEKYEKIIEHFILYIQYHAVVLIN